MNPLRSDSKPSPESQQAIPPSASFGGGRGLAKRDTSLELYRVSMIIGVCFLHSITFAKFVLAPAYNSVCMFCVVGFALISGWFGVRPSIDKFLRLYGVGLWCAALSVLLRVFADGEALKQCFFLEVRDQIWRFWFLHAYIAIMLAAPVLNAAFDNIKTGWRIAIPMVSIVFAWGWASGLWPEILPSVPGLAKGGYSGIVLSAVYVVGRVMRQFDFQGKRLDVRVSLSVFTLCAAMVCWLPDIIGKSPRAFAAYNSPVVLVMAVASFYIFRQIPVNRLIAKCLDFMRPSVFAIYLLQTNTYAIPKIRAFATSLDNYCPRIFTYLLTASAVFAICLLSDLFRRSAVCISCRIFALIKTSPSSHVANIARRKNHE